MRALTGLIKPCYVFAPHTLVRRIGLMFSAGARRQRTVRLPWGHVLEVNAGETIGIELLKQGIFDIAVSEAAWRLLRPGDRAVDVGANIGYMTSLFAARVGPHGSVDAFEPHPRILERLEHNVSRLRRGTAAAVTVHRRALGDRSGAARLLEPEAFGVNEGTATIARQGGMPSPSAEREGVDVELARLDAILDVDRIKLLKVDVEGFELQVLAGAERLLATGRIENVIYEAHDCERSPVHGLLKDSGYSIMGIGHDLLGLRMTAGSAAPAVDRSWESPSYLATRDPQAVNDALRGRGWRVLGK